MKGRRWDRRQARAGRVVEDRAGRADLGWGRGWPDRAARRDQGDQVVRAGQAVPLVRVACGG